MVSSSQGQRILLVDDDTSVLNLMIRALDGYQLTIAHDGAEAMALAADLPTLDLTITDSEMPSMTGKELINRLRGERPDLKALLVTGRTSTLAADEREWTGVIVLAKPFGISTLQTAVAAMLGAE